MRIGEILVGSLIIEANSLATALSYASSKNIPVGRALRALKFISEQDLNRALDAQLCIREGMDPQLAVSLCRYAHETSRSFGVAIKTLPASVQKEKVPGGVLEMLSQPEFLEETRAIKKPAMPQNDRPAEKYIMQGDQFLAANQLDLAETAYQRAREQLEGDSAPDKLSVVLGKLANLYLSIDRFDDAEHLYKRVIELQSKLHGKDSAEEAHAMEDLGDVYLIQERHDDAREQFSAAIALVEQKPIADPVLAARLINKLASSLPILERNALPPRLGELATDAGLLPKEQLDAALQEAEASGRPLGLVLRNQNILDAAQIESLMFAQLLLKQGSMPPKAMARAIKVAGALRISLRQLCEAGGWVDRSSADEDSYQQLVVEQERLLMMESVLGPDDPELATIAVRLADVHAQRKDSLSAQVLYKRALMILRKTNADKMRIAKLCEKLAQMLCQEKKYEEAQPLVLESVQCRRAGGGGESLETAKCIWLAAKIEIIQANYAAAQPLLHEAKQLFDKLSPGGCPPQLTQELAACSAKNGKG